jgi:tetratricopeptide (TPR) repeat protein
MNLTRQIAVVFSLVVILSALARPVLADKASHFEIAYQLTGLILDKKMTQDSVSILIGDFIKTSVLKDPEMRPHGETITRIVLDTIGEIFADEEFQRRFREEMAKAYVELFTETELQEMITFYSSNVGQKMTRTQPELARRILALSRQMGETSGDKIRQRFEEKFREAQQKGILPQKQTGSGDAEFYFNRGNEHEQKGRLDEAISDFSKGLKINPKDSRTYSNRGNIYRQKGQYDQAISDFNKALEINPKDTVAYNNLAWILATAKEPNVRNGQKAIEYASKACELTDWKNSNALDTLAAAYARVGDFGNAIKWQGKALEYSDISERNEVQQRLNSYREHRPWVDD